MVAVVGHDTADGVREASVVEGGALAAAMEMATGAATGVAGVTVWVFWARAVVVLVSRKDGGRW